MVQFLCTCALIVLLLAGCAAPPASSPQAQLRLPPQTAKTAVRPADAAAAADLRTTPRVSAGELLPTDESDDELASAEGDDDEAIDEETLQDTLAQEGLKANPPAEEGETVFIDVSEADLPLADNEKVRYFIGYLSGPASKSMRIWLERSGRYLPMMQEVFAEAGLPRDLVYLAMIESGFNNRALSRAKASGPWQFMDGTGRLYGLSSDWWRDERRDFEKATRAAAAHLGDLYRMFDGDWYLAMAAYNAGAGKIKRAIERYDSRDFWELARGSYLKPETKNYVPKMLAALQIAKHPERYGFENLSYQEPLSYDQVTVPSTTDLAVIARLAASDYESIKKLNPELKRWSTPPGLSSYPVRVPAGAGALFTEAYANLPAQQRVNVAYHKVKKGDTVGALAKRFGVRSDEIVRFNRLASARSLRVGQSLLIPVNPEAGSLTAAELRDLLREETPAGQDKGKDARKTVAKRYTVRSGDTLAQIAKRFKISEKELRSWNKLSGSHLKVGQILLIKPVSRS